jgi:bifunctional DNA-binding transcriptional regulator/antitoxin component of YhaV-PrlF toxin-antitoxin module
MEKILKATSKGQITLPANWRKNFSTDFFSVVKKGNNVLEIRPISFDKIEKKEEYTVFDAIRDNKGKGIKASDLVNILNELD